MKVYLTKKHGTKQRENQEQIKIPGQNERVQRGQRGGGPNPEKVGGTKGWGVT